MKRITNTRRTHGPVTSWAMRRIVGSCEHSILVNYTRNEPRNIVARRIRLARLQLYISVDQQRDAIRLQNQYILNDYAHP